MDEIIEAFKQTYPQNNSGEKPAEEQTSTGSEVKTDTKTDPATGTEPAKTTITFDPSDFNEKYGKKYGREVKEEKELQELFSAPTKITEHENKYKELENSHNLTKKQFEELQSKYESEKENLKFIDLKKYFANEDLYKINQVKLKFPDKDVSVISDIIKSDLSKVNPVDLLIKQARLNDFDIYAEMDDSQVKEVLADKFNNADLNDSSTWDNVTKARIAKAAKEARVELEALQKVELPIPIDIEKEKESLFSKEKAKIDELKNQWNPIVNKMLSDFKELIVPDPDDKAQELYKYTPELSDSFKAETLKVIDYLANTGQSINEQTVSEVLEDYIKGRFIIRELPKIMKAHALSVATKINDEWHTKIHNDMPLSERTRSTETGEQVWDKMAEMI